VNHASGEVMSSDPEVVEVDHVIRHRPMRGGLAESAVRAVGVAVLLVFAEQMHQVGQVPDESTVGELSAKASEPPFHNEVAPT